MRIGIKKGITSIGIVALFMTACNNDKATPGFTFMDDMYRSPSLETYGADTLFANGMATQLPVEGTISRGHMPYGYENSNEGYDSARINLMLPAAYKNDETLKGAKDLYNKMCSHCHGTKGDGNGALAEREKFLGIPGYDNVKLPNISPGSIYHVIMYGRNFMGSHASQLTEKERWEIVSYVWYDLRGEAKDFGDHAATVESEEIETEVTEDNSH